LNRQLGRSGDALDDWRHAIVLAERQDADRPGLREFRGDLAGDFNQLGSLLLESDPPAAAEALAALDRARELFLGLMRKHPGVPDYQSGLGTSLLERGRAEAVLGKAGPAREDSVQARDLFDRLVHDNPGVTEYQWGLARSCDAVGHEPTGGGRGDLALESLGRATAILEGLVKLDPGNFEYAGELGHVLSDRAAALVRLGRDREAADDLRQAIAAHRAAVAKAPRLLLFQRRRDADQSALARITKEPARPDSTRP
jgi:tetratricopeptide (TPR) repeat protein